MSVDDHDEVSSIASKLLPPFGSIDSDILIHIYHLSSLDPRPSPSCRWHCRNPTRRGGCRCRPRPARPTLLRVLSQVCAGSCTGGRSEGGLSGRNEAAQRAAGMTGGSCPRLRIDGRERACLSVSESRRRRGRHRCRASKKRSDGRLARLKARLRKSGSHGTVRPVERERARERGREGRRGRR